MESVKIPVKKKKGGGRGGGVEEGERKRRREATREKTTIVRLSLFPFLNSLFLSLQPSKTLGEKNTSKSTSSRLHHHHHYRLQLVGQGLNLLLVGFLALVGLLGRVNLVYIKEERNGEPWTRRGHYATNK